MIEVPRRAIKQFRSVLRKSVLAAAPRGPCPPVLFRAGGRGLALSCQQAGNGLRLHPPGRHPGSAACLPASALAEVEGPGGDCVRLEQAAPFKARASWEAGEALAREFDTADPGSLAAAPEMPPLAEAEAGLLPALAGAARTAIRDPSRAAISRVPLRGGGAVIGTDGRQLLVHSGFALPWEGDLLLPALPAYACKELAGLKPLRLGRLGDLVAVAAGPWALLLRAEGASRYPDVDKAVPGPEGRATRLRLHADDALEVQAKLPSVTGRDRERAAVTLDLASLPPSLRARHEKDGLVEVPMERSIREGPPVRVAVDRRHLLRALALGFLEIVVCSPDRPLVSRDARRRYVWMPLDGSQLTPPRNATARRNHPMTGTNGKDHQQQGSDSLPGDPDPLVEAEALRAHLQEAMARTARLVALLRQQRRQSRAIQSAVASLRKLPPLGS